MKAKWLAVMVSAVTVFFMTQVVHADLYTFYNITNNSPVNAAIGEAQLSVNVSDATATGINKVLFTFYNNGPNACSITDVYFQDGPLFGISSINGSSGVSFSQWADPGNLPGGSSIDPPFVTTRGFSADSDTPHLMANGVNSSSEWLNICFALINGNDFTDVIDSLNSEALRIGIHVQGFANGGSESFVNNPPAPVPEPGTMLLLGTGLIGLAGLRKKMAKN
jgi:hypothetical protein